ncbi:hypothetical protein F4677DRAFT_442551 [Hypoxylon crocopeplum]|nr:hypothetical protein F4677DRAFT_442551 [Hypoxylon crocopeplum]
MTLHSLRQFCLLFSSPPPRSGTPQLLIRHRTWSFIPFLIGCLFETIGYAARGYSAKQTPDWTLMPYIIQSLLILLGPTMFAASIYVVLGRLIRSLKGEAFSLIRGGGGGILATAKSDSSQSLGNNVILFGLGVQIVFFGCFMIVTAVFHVRIAARPTSKSQATVTPWRNFLWVLYFASLLIMVRSIFRMAEYGQG